MKLTHRKLNIYIRVLIKTKNILWFRKSKLVYLLKYSLAKSEFFVLVCLHGHQVFSSPQPPVAFLSFSSSSLRWGQIKYRKDAFNLMSGVVMYGKEVAKESIQFVLAWCRVGCFAEISGDILRDPARTPSILFTDPLFCKDCGALSLVSLCFLDKRNTLL